MDHSDLPGSSHSPVGTVNYWLGPIFQVRDTLRSLSKTTPYTLNFTSSSLYFQSRSQPCKVADQIKSHQHGAPLSHLTALSKNCICREWRDKIYGLLGLASDVSEGSCKWNTHYQYFNCFNAASSRTVPD